MRRRRPSARRAASIRLLAEPTAEGIALRVDPTLRPGGRGGRSRGSLEATLEYYERQSATWERQAMIKARPVAGRPVARRGVRRRRHAVRLPGGARPAARSTTSAARRSGWRSTSGGAARSSPRSSAAAAGSATSSSRCSCCRSCTAGATRRLREPNTLRALATLAEEGYVAQADAEALADAYRFLRTLGAPAADRARPADARPARRSARADDARALARAGATPPRCRPSTSGRRSWSAGSTSGCSTARCSRRSPDRRRRAPAWTARRPRSCWPGSGSRRPAAVVRGAAAARRPVDPDGQGAGARVPGDGAGARAGVRTPITALVRLERVAEAVGDAARAADALAADPAARRAGWRTWSRRARSPPTCSSRDPERVARRCRTAAAPGRRRRPRWSPRSRGTRRASSSRGETGAGARRRRRPRGPRGGRGRRARPAVRGDRAWASSARRS